jgi:hypothetical protein
LKLDFTQVTLIKGHVAEQVDVEATLAGQDGHHNHGKIRQNADINGGAGDAKDLPGTASQIVRIGKPPIVVGLDQTPDVVTVGGGGLIPRDLKAVTNKRQGRGGCATNVGKNAICMR